MPSNCLIFCRPFSSRLQSFPALGSFPVSQFFTSGGHQSIGASASVLLMNIQGWFPLGWTGWISLQSKGLSGLRLHHSSKASILQLSAFFIVLTLTSIHEYWKNHSFSSKEQLFFNFMTAVTICSDLGAQKNKSLSVSILSLFICHEVMGPDAMILVFWIFNFKPTFPSPLSLSSRGFLVFLCFLP